MKREILTTKKYRKDMKVALKVEHLTLKFSEM